MAASVAFVAWALHWFSQQPYSISEHLQRVELPGVKTLLAHTIPSFFKQCLGEIFLLSLPVLLLFTPKIAGSRRAIRVTASVALFAIGFAGLLHMRHEHDKLFSYFPPYIYNNLWFRGFDQCPSYVGDLPLLLTDRIRVLLGFLSFVGLLGLIGALVTSKPEAEPMHDRDVVREGAVAWGTAKVLLLPSLVLYLMLLIPRHVSVGLNDRYLLFPEFVFLVFLSYWYQRRCSSHFPAVVWVLILVMGILDCGGMHDTFALYRAQETLLDQVTARGVTRNRIDGGTQYNGWTEMFSSGHANDPRITVPKGAYQPRPIYGDNDPCHTAGIDKYPSIHARYVVSLNPAACGGPTDVPPVTYRTFFSPHERRIYMVWGPESGPHS